MEWLVRVSELVAELETVTNEIVATELVTFDKKRRLVVITNLLVEQIQRIEDALKVMIEGK